MDRGLLVVTLLTCCAAYAILWLTGVSDIRHLADDLIAAYFISWSLLFLLSKESRNELRKRFVLLSVTLVVSVGGFEAVGLFGVVDYRLVFSTPIFDPWRSPTRLFDAELLWIHPPHQRLVGNYTRGNIGEFLCLPPRPVQPYDLRYDHHGFRNDVDLTGADIAVIGDSYVESPNVPSEALMTSVLARLQGKTVANLGMAGYGPQQELIVLERYALSLHPKTIIWVFFEGNDLLDVHAYEEKRAKLAADSQPIRAAWQRSFTKNALSALLRLYKGCMPNPYFEQRYGVIETEQHGRVRLYFGDAGMTLTPKDLAALQKTRETLASAYARCSEQGIRFVVAFAPIAYRVYRNLVSLEEDSGDIRWWTVNDLPQQLARIAAEIAPDIGYLDLTPFLRRAAEQGTLVYIPDDTHWTPEGHWVVAEAMSDFLSSQKPGSRAPTLNVGDFLALQENRRSSSAHPE